jgi:transposase-like protein
MVEAVRSGRSQHQVARDFGVSPATVNRWVRHAQGQRLDRVNWSDRPSIPRVTQRTEGTIEDLVLDVRRQLQAESDLGFFGAEAILQDLRSRGVEPLPAERTIYRILGRRGALDHQHRARRPPPPPGWYLPEVARRGRELDSFDIVEGLVIRDGPQVEVLNGISLHGGLVASWPRDQSITAKFVVERLVEHWRQFGLPGYAQFDNDTVFQGTHAHPDAVGRVSRLCLSLGVIPVFVPPREPGFQASVENYNGSWQARVWARFQHADLDGVIDRSSRHVAALRRHRADRIESAPLRGHSRGPGD